MLKGTGMKIERLETQKRQPQHTRPAAADKRPPGRQAVSPPSTPPGAPPETSEIPVESEPAGAPEPVPEAPDFVQEVLNRKWSKQTPTAVPPVGDSLDAAVEAHVVRRRQGTLARRASCPEVVTTVPAPREAPGQQHAARPAAAARGPSPDQTDSRPASPPVEVQTASPPESRCSSRRSQSRCSSRPCSAARPQEEAPAVPARSRRRRYTNEFEDLEDDIMSPTWIPPKRQAGDWHPSSTRASSASSPVSTLDGIAQFTNMAQDMEGLVHLTAVRINDYLEIIRRQMVDRPDMFDSPVHRQKLDTLIHMLRIVNYRLGKWLQQLVPAKYPVPRKPQRGGDTRCPADLLAEVSFACSRMELVASWLAPLMRDIVSDARSQPIPHGPSPLRPAAFRNPAALAQDRGIKDIDALHGLPLHLEHALQVSHFLAQPPIQVKSMRAATDVVLAVSRFKGKLGRRASLPNRGSPPLAADDV